MKRTRLFAAFVLCLALVFSLTSCFSPTNETTTSGQGQTSEDSDETTAPAGDVVVTVWDNHNDGAGMTLYQGFADAFAVEYNVTVDRVTMLNEDLRNTIKPAINSGEGPDVFSYDPGAGYLGVLASSGLAYDLTDYAAEQGWWDRHMDWTLEQCTFGGKLYGIGNQVETLGVFYNKQIFADNGLDIPETYDDFLTLCDTLKELGELPIILDDLDQWPGFHLESLWLNAGVGNKAVAEVLALNAQWDQPEFGAALDKLYDIVEAGFTVESPNAVSYEDANKLFNSGQVAMRPTGTWMISGYEDPEEGLGEAAGFFFLPPFDGIPMSAPGGIGEAVVVSGKTEIPEMATKYLDFMFTGDRVRQWYESAYIPSVEGIDPNEFDLTPLFKEVALELLSAEEMGYNIDVLMPAKVNDVTKNFVQELLSGRKTGLECMEEKQQAYQEEIDAGNYEAVE